MKNLNEITIKYFNRHEIFNKSDLNLVGKLHFILMNLPSYAYQDEDGYSNDFENKLCGLYDGYLYSDIQLELGKVKEIPSSLHIKFNSLIKKIETNLD